MVLFREILQWQLTTVEVVVVGVLMLNLPEVPPYPTAASLRL